MHELITVLALPSHNSSNLLSLYESLTFMLSTLVLNEFMKL